MALTLNEGTSFTPAPAGLHNAVCVWVIDLGTQATPFGNKAKVLLGWELVNALQDDGRPFVISRQFGATLSKQGALRPLIESWRGRPLTQDEAAGFDLKTLVGQPCKVLIQHAETKDGRLFANVSAVIKADPGQPTTAQAALVFFDQDQPDPVAQSKLPDWINRLIEQAVRVEKKPAPAPQPPAPFDDDLADFPL
jgi:hypothetical protein